MPCLDEEAKTRPSPPRHRVKGRYCTGGKRLWSSVPAAENKARKTTYAGKEKSVCVFACSIAGLIGEVL